MVVISPSRILPPLECCVYIRILALSIISLLLHFDLYLPMNQREHRGRDRRAEEAGE